MRFLSYLLIAVLCLGFTACSDDNEDDKGGKSIEGTWKYTSTNDEDLRSGTFTFKSGSSLTWYNGEGTSNNCTYTLTGNKLKIVLNQDDYIEGTLTISNNNATFKYTWHDYDGEWDDEEEYTMTLQKQ